jgi:hypothetical protein
MAGYLQELAAMPEGNFVMEMGNLRLKVGASDKAAATRLIEVIDKFSAEEKTNGEALYFLTERWMVSLKDALDTMPPEEAMLDPEVSAWWDALWWFRLLIALDVKEQVGVGDIAPDCEGANGHESS